MYERLVSMQSLNICTIPNLVRAWKIPEWVDTSCSTNFFLCDFLSTFTTIPYTVNYRWVQESILILISYRMKLKELKHFLKKSWLQTLLTDTIRKSSNTSRVSPSLMNLLDCCILTALLPQLTLTRPHYITHTFTQCSILVILLFPQFLISPLLFFLLVILISLKRMSSKPFPLWNHLKP